MGYIFLFTHNNPPGDSLRKKRANFQKSAPN
jgi:hypothetical protein